MIVNEREESLPFVWWWPHRALGGVSEYDIY